MLRNWRSSLLFSKLAFQDDNLLALSVVQDVYKPIEYIALNGNALRGESTLHWAQENFGEFGFDFDSYSGFLWPMSDDVPAKTIVSRINAAFPKLASIKIVSPAMAHGLDEIATLSFEERVINDSIENSNINLSFE